MPDVPSQISVGLRSEEEHGKPFHQPSSSSSRRGYNTRGLDPSTGADPSTRRSPSLGSLADAGPSAGCSLAGGGRSVSSASAAPATGSTTHHARHDHPPPTKPAGGGSAGSSTKLPTAVTGLNQNYDASQWGGWRSHRRLLEQAKAELNWTETESLLREVFRNFASSSSSSSATGGHQLREDSSADGPAAVLLPAELLMSVQEFADVMSAYKDCCSSLADVSLFFDAFDRKKVVKGETRNAPTGWLSADEFVQGVMVMSPDLPGSFCTKTSLPCSTAGAGKAQQVKHQTAPAYAQLRLQTVFQFYDVGRKGQLSVEDLGRLVLDLLRIREHAVGIGATSSAGATGAAAPASSGAGAAASVGGFADRSSADRAEQLRQKASRKAGAIYREECSNAANPKAAYRVFGFAALEHSVSSRQLKGTSELLRCQRCLGMLVRERGVLRPSISRGGVVESSVRVVEGGGSWAAETTGVRATRMESKLQESGGGWGGGGVAAGGGLYGGHVPGASRSLVASIGSSFRGGGTGEACSGGMNPMSRAGASSTRSTHGAGSRAPTPGGSERGSRAATPLAMRPDASLRVPQSVVQGRIVTEQHRGPASPEPARTEPPRVTGRIVNHESPISSTQHSRATTPITPSQPSSSNPLNVAPQFSAPSVTMGRPPDPVSTAAAGSSGSSPMRTSPPGSSSAATGTKGSCGPSSSNPGSQPTNLLPTLLCQPDSQAAASHQHHSQAGGEQHYSQQAGGQHQHQLHDHPPHSLPASLPSLPTSSSLHPASLSSSLPVYAPFACSPATYGSQRAEHLKNTRTPAHSTGASHPSHPSAGAMAESVALRIIRTTMQIASSPHFDWGSTRPRLCSAGELFMLCDAVIGLLRGEDSLVELPLPCRVYGDIHGQLPDLLHFFNRFVLLGPGLSGRTSAMVLYHCIRSVSHDLCVTARILCHCLRARTQTQRRAAM